MSEPAVALAEAAPPPKKPNVFLGIPTYDGWIHSGLINPILDFRTVYPSVLQIMGGSLLAYQFNGLWLAALQSGADWFLMCHADIVPEQKGFSQLVDEAIALDADVLSVVSPIKTPEGITSTGLADADTLWFPRRLTMKEVYACPETFTAADTDSPEKALLINTGLMAVNLKRDWAREAKFTIKDRFGMDPSGHQVPLVLPEDWGFSWFLHERGAKVYATRKVKIDHWGAMAFPNTEPWGSCATDPAHPELFQTTTPPLTNA